MTTEKELESIVAEIHAVHGDTTNPILLLDTAVGLIAEARRERDELEAALCSKHDDHDSGPCIVHSFWEAVAERDAVREMLREVLNTHPDGFDVWNYNDKLQAMCPAPALFEEVTERSPLVVGFTQHIAELEGRVRELEALASGGDYANTSLRRALVPVEQARTEGYEAGLQAAVELAERWGRKADILAGLRAALRGDGEV